MRIKLFYWRVILLGLAVFHIKIMWNLPVRYYDEVLWIGRSYFAHFYFNGQWQDPAWQSELSFTQPKLGELAYGAWNYPRYWGRKLMLRDKNYDYPWYLIDNGFYEIDVAYTQKYASDPFLATFIDEQINSRAYDNPDYFENNKSKYVSLVTKFTRYNRLFSLFCFWISLGIVYKLVNGVFGKWVSMLFIIYYGTNSWVMESAFRAHVEGLFLMLFAGGIYLIINFADKNDWKKTGLIGLVIGLATAAKLNGIMLWPLFILMAIFRSRLDSWKLTLARIILVSGLTFGVFVALNPFTWPKPIANSIFIFNFRTYMAKLQGGYAKNDLLPDFKSRIFKIGENFYVREASSNFNASFGANKSSQGWRVVSALLAIVGVVVVFVTGQKIGQYLFWTLMWVVVSMGIYLTLDWFRYYVHLTLLIYFFQFYGGWWLTNLWWRWWRGRGAVRYRTGEE